ncbi:Na+/H+ antiporter NhaA [Sphingomonas xinjiangensis]|uniref:Na+/H+ antiporter NhaA n=1 Tax=Sphingomonas xinjiangensis TaxID=643568 RepID=A0A840YLA3_9SPHN|nr:Na+/H+ antiporter NhaA [Sphingomonas xinjiangensis]
MGRSNQRQIIPGAGSAIPASDIAFALGIIALLGSRAGVPADSSFSSVQVEVAS